VYRFAVPELPEVESVRLSLLPHLIGRTFTAASLVRRDVLIAPGDPPGGFPRQRKLPPARPTPISPADLLVSATVSEIRRRGKQLALVADREDRALVVQLGMTGHLELLAADHASQPHVHARWTLPGARVLVFRDPRRFGSLRVFRSLAALDMHWQDLGPDALTIAGAQLHAALRATDRPIKAALLDQAVLAGVGNIYADESLFIARINPRFRARRLSATQFDTLAAAIRTVLGRSIEHGGSTLRDYADGDGRPGSYQTRHAVYGRAGLPCPNCSRPLSTATLAQRTTVWCAFCQPLRTRR
jgi:formamidopyrimidine-DNA glycosylase